MPSTLVTGAPGWLGTRLVRVLVEGLPELPALPRPDLAGGIRCLAIPGSDVSRLSGVGRVVEVQPGDLRDTGSVEAFFQGAAGAALFHCAGVIHPTRGVREFFEVNVEGTRRLLQAAEEAGVRRAVVVSSNSPTGTNPHRDHLFDEASPYHPYMGYGRSKMLMEQIVGQFQARGKLETVIVRPPWFYGPDQPPRQTLFFRMIKEGTMPIVGDGENKRSMAYVDNLCQGLLLAAATPGAAGQTYWIADRRPYTMNEIVDTVERLMENEFGVAVSHKRLRLPTLVGEAATLCDRLLQGLGLYHQKIHVLSEMNKTIACSVAKAQRELGYDPIVELEEGMRRSLAWLRENGQNL
ncbi:MAG: NAD-dependent epimerase/dehydratase family protein [Acidobacteria bacterium]|nr:NAD-dependent epimerase/dehydratase family protein [Acidobacteriota bacterium]